MKKSRRSRPYYRGYERAGTVVLGQVPLGQAPISLRKSRWMKRVRWSLVALAVLIGALALWLTLDLRFYVYGAEMVGTRRVSPQEILEASELLGLHILWARPSVIEARVLDRVPALESAEVNCSLPSNCSIAVVERQPRVLWNDGTRLWWIDGNGAVFPAEAGAGGPEVDGFDAPRRVVTGQLPRGDEGNLDPQVRVALTELWTSGAEIPAGLDYAAEQGLGFVDHHGWRIVLGQGSGMLQRLQALALITARLESRGEAVRTVDVRFPGAPYYAPVSDS